MKQQIDRSETTVLITEAANGVEESLNALAPLLYRDLRSIAHNLLLSERPNRTLQTTGLVHEAYLRLANDDQITHQGRAYFFGAAARTMRRILVDSARRRLAAKRGGNLQRQSVDLESIPADKSLAEIIDLDDALTSLKEVYARPAQVVECRFFGGLSIEETSRVIGISKRTVSSDWLIARAWLYDHMHLDQ